jgi:hypothetical protein
LADFQSLNDLMLRRDKIKNAINLSNSTTMVTIGDQLMTVSQAIEYKNTIKYKMELLNRLRVQRHKVMTDFQNHKDRVQHKIDDNIRIVCGRDNKPDAALIQSVSEGIVKNEPAEIFDPLKLETVIKELELSISNFTSNVDFALSESNALTIIDI